MKKETETDRKIEFALPCVASNLEIQFSGTANIRTIYSDGAEAGTYAGVTVPYVAMATTKPTDDVS